VLGQLNWLLLLTPSHFSIWEALCLMNTRGELNKGKYCCTKVAYSKGECQQRRVWDAKKTNVEECDLGKKLNMEEREMQISWKGRMSNAKKV
jgi:hypothetical protein